MTAKDKAGELFNKYYQYDITIIGIDSRMEERGISLYDAKKLALICVDEILNSSPSLPILGDGGYLYEDIELSKNYWQEVKSELEKL
jgi:hypothetical protein